jgi:zinc transport system substrate-binding protein
MALRIVPMKKSPALLVALPLTLLLAACGGGAADDDGTTSVVASFYPLAFVAERVGGSFVNVDNLTSPGVEPHDLELKPQQIGALQDADLVVYQHDFQTAVDAGVEQADRSDDVTVDAASVVQLHAAAEDEHAHEEEHAHADEEEGHDHEHEEEGHDHGGLDPHFWLDPSAMVPVAEAVADRLSELDPDHAADFAANADALVAELEELDTAFTDGLATCRTRTMVTTHAAFGYLASRYDLEQHPIAGIDPANEPSPSQLADITELVRTEKITTIFTEQLVSPAIARTIADETGATTATLDPIEGLSDETSDEDYLP